MSKNLIFPKCDDVESDPVVEMARKTLFEAGKKQERAGKPSRKPRCYNCGEDFEKENLKRIYIKQIGRQVNVCGKCNDFKEGFVKNSKNDPVAKTETPAAIKTGNLRRRTFRLILTLSQKSVLSVIAICFIFFRMALFNVRCAACSTMRTGGCDGW